jgi:hypothetical protein
MKNVLSCSLLCIAILTIFSCKKSSDGINWKEALKNTVWTGEFKYTTGPFQELQPFSIEINSNGTVTWADEGSIRDGGTWKVNGDIITLTFPNQTTTFTATLATVKWSNFSNQEINGLKIDNISAATAVQQSDIVHLTFAGSINEIALQLKFLPLGKIEITKGTEPAFSLPYTVSGAGIRFEDPKLFHTDIYFMIFQNNMTTIKGFEKRHFFISLPTGYYIWTARKQ